MLMIKRAFSELLRGFCALQNIQFAAPWRETKRC